MGIDDWLTAYGESHQNPINEAIHWVCVPIITITLVAFLSLLQVNGLPLRGSHVFLFLVLVFYARLSWRLALGMFPVMAAILLAIAAMRLISLPLWQTALALFVLAWAGQFAGHKIEGKKPSFLEDVQFLLIGPLWLLAGVYRKLGLRY
jgi:uncharacterized membrane protein YGL010W